MMFFIIMTVFSTGFVVISGIEIVDAIKSGRVLINNWAISFIVIGAVFCLCIVTTFPVAIYEIDKTKKELRELKEQKDVESVYEPVNEILYRKCEQE